MNDFPEVYVIMLTYNHSEDTRQALISLRGLTYPHVRLLVIDNQSTDETVSMVRRDFPEVTLVINPTNLGFAAGINVGIHYAIESGAKLVLLINNDVVVAPDMLDHLVAALEDDVGATAPLIYYLDDPTRIWSAGFNRHPLIWEMRGGARDALDTGQWSVPFEVDYLLGCALLLNCDVLQKVGFFDECYFFYYEDLDLSWRIQKSGYPLLTVPQAHMWHKGSGSAGSSSEFRVYHMARSSTIFFRSHAVGWRRFVIFLFRVGSALRKSWNFAFAGKFQHLRALWRGMCDGWQIS